MGDVVAHAPVPAGGAEVAADNMRSLSVKTFNLRGVCVGRADGWHAAGGRENLAGRESFGRVAAHVVGFTRHASSDTHDAVAPERRTTPTHNLPAMSTYTVNSAVYGALNTTTSQYQTLDITAALQQLINAGGATPVVTFNNTNFTDPCPGYPKAFGVSIAINGTNYFYAGTEGQAVNFTQAPINPAGVDDLQASALTATLVTGGWPTSANNYLFSACGFTLTNVGSLGFPVAGQSTWVSVDFYLTTSNSTTQPVSGLTKIGDQGVQITSLAAGKPFSVNVGTSSNGLFNMGRLYTGNPGLLPTGNYYLYVQVRNAAGTVNLGEGAFSAGTFTPVPPS